MRQVASVHLLLRPALGLHLEQNQADLLGRHIRTSPIVQVVLQIAVADAKLKRHQELVVVHQVERVEDVKVGVLGGNEGIVHQVQPWRLRRNIVERVGGLDVVVHRMMHNGRRQRVVADQVSDGARRRILDDVATNDTVLRREPVAELFFVEYRDQGKLLQVVVEQLVRSGQILVNERTIAGRLRRIGQFVEFNGTLHRHVAR